MTKRINSTTKANQAAKASPKVTAYAIVNSKTGKTHLITHTRQQAREELFFAKHHFDKNFAIFKMVAEKQVR